ncbi:MULTISPECIES: SCO1860 family LAETG-anchored protein [unclassified Streptomyces]|uniref:SCO1860 family LAETG-anchored protein n=1 Tax=unclassified Streptomyces TaxID=2593676 RepID=UPI000CD5AEE0|nr:MULTISPECIES: SCO1860 family LAETG-anchored protein [unclassified Streptomyces]AWL37706.1 LPXTG cell wall anchor domain-containing protein [Streptomyces sp. SM18]
MNSNTFRLAALAVAAAPVALLVAVPAQAATATVPATPDTAHGKASAVVLRTGLDVSLLNKAVDVPLKVTLNEVHAPASAEKSALSVKLDGVDQGQPVEVLQADVATAEATADAHKAEGRANLVKARVHVPGLPRLSLIEVEEVTSKALCETGKKPVAESNVLGHVSVLGKRISLSSGGTTNIEVPGVGSVTLDLSKTSTTTRTAAATALQLRVSVNPLKLNVAEVEGEVTLAEATCETPKGGGSGNGGSGNGGSENGGSGNGGSENGGSGNGGSENGGSGNGGSENGGSGNGGATGGDDGSGHEGGTGGDGSGKGEGISDVKPQTGTDKAQASGTGDLAETGSSSSTPYIAGGAAVLLAAGAGATVIARRRSTQN